MEKIKSVLICGLGAIGSIYAANIKDNTEIEPDVLIDKHRLEHYKAEKLIYNAKEYDFNYILPSNTDKKADLIIIATKNDALKQVIENIKNFVHKDTIIMCVANGIKSEELLKEHYNNVLYSYIIGHTSFRNGREIIHDGVNTTVFGEINNEEYSRNVQLVKEFFDKARINYEIPINMESALWKKFMLNVGINQISAVLRVPFSAIQKSEDVMNATKDLMKEVRDIAVKMGIQNAESIYEEAVADIFKMIPDGRSSMLQDIEAKRATEVEYFAGTVIELGKKYDIPTPANKVFYRFIHIAQSQYLF